MKEINCLKQIGLVKGSSSIRKASGYMPRSHQKGIRKQPMLENVKTDTEVENFSFHYILDG